MPRRRENAENARFFEAKNETGVLVRLKWPERLLIALLCLPVARRTPSRPPRARPTRRAAPMPAHADERDTRAWRAGGVGAALSPPTPSESRRSAKSAAERTDSPRHHPSLCPLTRVFQKKKKLQKTERNPPPAWKYIIKYIIQYIIHNFYVYTYYVCMWSVQNHYVCMYCAGS